MAKSRTVPEQKLANVIQTHDFLEHYKDMISYEDISREYEELKNCFRTEVVSRVAQLPGNRGKNRYMNVLANEATRVKLTGSYINANYIEIKSQARDYIATQGKSHFQARSVSSNRNSILVEHFSPYKNFVISFFRV